MLAAPAAVHPKEKQIIMVTKGNSLSCSTHQRAWFKEVGKGLGHSSERLQVPAKCTVSGPARSLFLFFFLAVKRWYYPSFYRFDQTSEPFQAGRPRHFTVGTSPHTARLKPVKSFTWPVNSSTKPLRSSKPWRRFEFEKVLTPLRSNVLTIWQGHWEVWSNRWAVWL